MPQRWCCTSLRTRVQMCMLPGANLVVWAGGAAPRCMHKVVCIQDGATEMEGDAAPKTLHQIRRGAATSCTLLEVCQCYECNFRCHLMVTGDLYGTLKMQVQKCLKYLFYI